MVNESARLAALRALSILDTPPEERFDRVTRLARKLFDVPICLVSLIDEERQWFKSCVGLDASETPRSQAFCAYAIEQEEALVVPDATRDDRFKDNPLVTGPPDIRFYAGHPLYVNGHGMGTLCIIDRRPRYFSDEDRECLRDFAHVVEHELNIGQVGEALDLYQQSERFYRELFEETPAFMLLVGEDGLVERANHAVREALGDVEGVALDTLMELPGTSSGTVQVRNSMWAYTTWKRRGQTLVHALDISERAALERAKEQFLAVASHELRTPVTSLRGSLLVLNQKGAELPPDLLRLVEMGLRGAERLFAVTEDMVLMTQLSLGVRLPVEYVSVADLGFDDEQLKVRAHRDSLERVLQHLLANAAKFPPVSTDCRKVDGGVQFAVSDHGPGLSDAQQKALFTRFGSLEEADTRRQGGLGLGLSLCRQVVEWHGGRMWVESEEGKGSTFYLWLPS